MIEKLGDFILNPDDLINKINEIIEFLNKFNFSFSNDDFETLLNVEKNKNNANDQKNICSSCGGSGLQCEAPAALCLRCLGSGKE